MKILKTLCAAALCLPLALHSQITANTLTPEEAVQLLLGDGIEAFNITFTGGADQVGEFDCVDCNLGMPSGFILASGAVEVCIGPNNIGSQTLGGGGLSGEPDLETANPGFNFNDVTVLEFDFVATGDSISFNYIFASEEYPEFVGSGFNDSFGFFLSGPGINGPYLNDAVNIAEIPGTSQAVTINNLNNGGDGLNGPCSYCEYYIHNGNGFDEPWLSDEFYIQFDGFTVSLVAEAEVQCGQQYHIKIAIADAGDFAYDSAVFIEEGSFSSNSLNIVGGIDNPPVFLPGNTVLEGCVDGYFTIYQPNLATADTVTLVISGSAGNGIDFEEIDLTVIIPEGEGSINVPLIPIYDQDDEGIETVTIEYSYINSCGDPDTASATMSIQDYVDLVLQLDNIELCPGETSTVNATPQNGAGNMTYDWSSGDTSSTVTFDDEDDGEYTVTVTDFCQEEIEVSFSIEVLPGDFSTNSPFELCLGLFLEEEGIADGGAGPYTYNYDEDSLSFNNQTGFTALYPGVFEIITTDVCGEAGITQLTVIVCDTRIPNIFTPEGSDTLNAGFIIEGLEGFPGSALAVFNRWGTLVYESDDYSNLKPWKAEDQADGVYFYVFKRSDGNEYTGYVHVLRKQ